MRASFAHALDQAMAIKHGMDGALGGNPDMAWQPPEQELADFARTPIRLVTLEGNDQALDLQRQLVGITHRPPRAIVESLTAMLPVAVENLVAGLARYAEISAHIRHRFPIQQPRDNAKALFHHRTLFPRHPHLPPCKRSEKCYPCVRYDVAPMSQAAHNGLEISKSLGGRFRGQLDELIPLRKGPAQYNRAGLVFIG
jgi:hypothetical protein